MGSWFPPIKITANIFPDKIYSRVNILYKVKFATQKYSTKKSCLFNLNLSLLFGNKTVYKEIVAYCLKICIFYCTLNKNENVINAGYCVLSENRKI